MRLAGQVKSGFFPCPPEAISLILKHLRLKDYDDAVAKHFRPDDFTVLDNCAGEGHALVQLADGLGISREHTHAIELNANRAARIREEYPDIRLVGPCSFDQTRITLSSFSLVYCNPPFDFEGLGSSGREEVRFVRDSMRLLVPRGILVLVCPLNQVMGSNDMVSLLDTWFDDTEVFVFPDAIRKYGECVVIGSRRREARHHEQRHSGPLCQRQFHYYSPKDGKVDWLGEAGPDTFSMLAELGTPQFNAWDVHYKKGAYPKPESRRPELDVWTLPFARPPRLFEKGGLTQEEMEVLLEQSPNYRLLEANTITALKRPPLGLNRGHTSLALLTGILDGYVPSDPPHVVRGYCGKTKQLSRTESYTTDAGTDVRKVIYSEVPQPIVRVVWPDGVIKTLTAESAAVEVDGQVNEEEEE